MTSSNSDLLFIALRWVPSLFLDNFRAFLKSFATPVLINSMTFIIIDTLFSYGVNPEHSLITYLTSPVLLPLVPFLKAGLSRIFVILVVMKPLFNPTAIPFIFDIIKIFIQLTKIKYIINFIIFFNLNY